MNNEASHLRAQRISPNPRHVTGGSHPNGPQTDRRAMAGPSFCRVKERGWGREDTPSSHPPVPQFPSMSLPAAAVLRKFLFSLLEVSPRQAPFPIPSGLRGARCCRKPATRPGAHYSLLPALLGPVGRGWRRAQPGSVPCQEHPGIQYLPVPKSPRTGHLQPLPQAGRIKHQGWDFLSRPCQAALAAEPGAACLNSAQIPSTPGSPSLRRAKKNLLGAGKGLGPRHPLRFLRPRQFLVAQASPKQGTRFAWDFCESHPMWLQLMTGFK